ENMCSLRVFPSLTQSGHRLCIAAMILMPLSALSKYTFKPIRCCLLSLGADMKRREFLSALSGAVAWPLTTQTLEFKKDRRLPFLGAAGLYVPYSYRLRDPE